MQVTGLQGSPLSTQQARLWALQKKSSVYRTLCSVQIKGIVQRDRLTRAVSTIVKRHEILRTVFGTLPGMDVPVQIIRDHELWSESEISLEHLDTPAQLVEIDELLASLQENVSDLLHNPPLRIWLLRLAAERHVLLISLPALCADSKSIKLFVDELKRAYMQEALAEEVLQYADVSAWQEDLLHEDEAMLQRQYWRGADLLQMTTMRLPFEREGHASERKKVDDAFAPCVVKISLQDDLAQQMEIQAQQYGASLSSWLLTCWQVLLWRLSGEPGFLVGVACDGRTHEELINALGLYTRFVPVPAYFEEDRSFVNVLASVDMSFQEAIKRQMYFTWEGMQECEESDVLPCFFPVSFEYETWSGTCNAGALTFSLVKRWSCSEPFVLKLSALRIEKHLQLEIHYDAQSISSNHVHRLNALLQTLMRSSVIYPHLPVGDLPFLESTEQAQLLVMGNGLHSSVSVQGLHRLFEAQVKRTPDQLAVMSGREQLTYQQVNKRANRLAQVLRRRGVGPNACVGLCMKRGVQMLVGLLGILKAGGAYVPLDTESPSARLIYQLQQSQAIFLLSERGACSHLSEWEERTLWLEDIEQEMAKARADDLSGGSEEEDLAYVIYTSGSTGVPKGAMIRQGSVVNYTLAVCQLLGAEPGWQYATVSTLAADLGNTAIFCALASGGCVHVLDYETVTSTEEMARWVEQHPIDVLKIVPSHLSALLTGERAQDLLPRRALMLGGEVLPLSLLEQLEALMGSCQIYNHYGPTETTIGVLVNPLGVLRGADKEKERWECVAVGRPINNTQVYILDRRMQLVPAGVTGELYIGGAGLAMGYMGQAEQTAERFVPHPYSEQVGARLYRTGDMARYSEQDKLEFVGRRDDQVKLRGYRIELAEIEAVLCQHPQIRASVVVLREDTAEEPWLVSYVVTRQNIPLPTGLIQEFLRQSLPEYMVPSVCMQLNALPLTTNGKVDRQKLPPPEQNEHDREQVFAGEPRSPIEEILIGIWKDLLVLPVIVSVPSSGSRKDKISSRLQQGKVYFSIPNRSSGNALGIYDNFFQKGGHSLLAMRVIARVQAVLQVTLPVQTLFEAPTVAELAQRVEQTLRKGVDKELPLLVAREEYPEQIPLSFAQQRLWFLDQLEPESTVYTKPLALRLHGSLDSIALESSLAEVMRRHDILRTSFLLRQEHPVQVIRPFETFNLPRADLSSLSPQTAEAELQRLIARETQRLFDLSQDPLLSIFLLYLGESEYVLLLNMHHILSDEWSNDVLIRELATLYQAFVARQPSPLAPLPIQYADYALWQRQWLQGEILEAQLTYWRKQLAGISPLALPTDHPRPAIQTHRGAVESLSLPPALSEGLQTLSQQENVTVFMLLLAAFQVLLMRYTGQADICVGTPIANRNHAEIENLIGLFVNTLVLRTDLSGDPTFQQVLQRVREVTIGAYAHQDIPFEKVVEKLQTVRDLSRSPLFQVVFILQNMLQMQGNLADMRVSLLSVERAISKFDLTLSVVETEQGLCATMEYNTDLFEAETIERMLGCWQRLLEAILHEPQLHVQDIPLLTEIEVQQQEQERHQLASQQKVRAQIPATQALVSDQLLHSFFLEQAAKRPDQLAVISPTRRLTYQETLSEALLLAQQVRRLGARPNRLVAVVMEKGWEQVVGVLGVLLSGAAYLPIDPKVPHERLCFLLEHGEVEVVVTQSWVEQRLSWPQSLHRLCVDALDALDGASRDGDLLAVQQGAEDLAYVIYTSGSTGVPKGVMIDHRAAVNTILEINERFAVGSQDRVLALSALHFDLSVYDFFGVLAAGGTIVLPAEEAWRNPAVWMELLVQEQVTLWNTVPALLEMLVEYADAHTDALRRMDLRLVLLSGDWIAVTLPDRVRTHIPQVEIVSLGGATEASIWSICYPITEVDPSWKSIPYGRPLRNQWVQVLNGLLEPCPVWMPGDLYIAGVGLARGYWRDEEKTQANFIEHPRSGERFYRTGDVGRYVPDGNIEFLGREDFQVKILGHRIELGEIEAVLERHGQVSAAVVVVQKGRSSGQQLWGYVVSKGAGAALSGQALRKYLQEKLPEYMVPVQVVVLEALPLTSNGKVDRQALPMPEEQETVQQRIASAVGTPIEEILTAIWCEILERSSVGRHDNFFALGGHSLLAMQLISRVKEVFQVEIPLFDLFGALTIAEMAQCVEDAVRQVIKVPSLVPMERTQKLPLSFAQQRLWFVNQLQPESTAYVFPYVWRLSGLLNIQALEWSLQELVCRHESLRTTFTESMGQPVQVIHPPYNYDLPVIDLQGLKRELREGEMRKLVEQEMQRLYDLINGPLMRASLLRLEEREHVQLLSAHHIVADGWSGGIFMREIAALYQAAGNGEPSPLLPLPIQYADYALWQRQWLQGEVLQKQLDYWRKQLAGVPTVMNLPIDRARSAVQSSVGAQQALRISSQEQLKALSQRENVTLFMILLAVFTVLLRYYTGQDDLVIGTDVANRNRVETESLIGFFVNQLVLRIDLTGNPSFLELLYRVRKMCIEAYAHQDFPFEQLVEALRPQRSLQYSPLFQVKFLFENSIDTLTEEQGKFLFPGITVRQQKFFPGTTQVDLLLNVSQTSEGLIGTFTYNTDLFNATTIERMARHFVKLLEKIGANPDIQIRALVDMIAKEEKMEKNEQNKKRANIAFAQVDFIQPEPICLPLEQA